MSAIVPGSTFGSSASMFFISNRGEFLLTARNNLLLHRLANPPARRHRIHRKASALVVIAAKT